MLKHEIASQTCSPDVSHEGTQVITCVLLMNKICLSLLYVYLGVLIEFIPESSISLLSFLSWLGLNNYTSILHSISISVPNCYFSIWVNLRAVRNGSFLVKPFTMQKSSALNNLSFVAWILLCPMILGKNSIFILNFF